jgi:hypothetical protein
MGVFDGGEILEFFYEPRRNEFGKMLGIVLRCDGSVIRFYPLAFDPDESGWQPAFAVKEWAADRIMVLEPENEHNVRLHDRSILENLGEDVLSELPSTLRKTLEIGGRR